MPKQSHFQTYIEFQRTVKKNKTLALVTSLVIFIHDLLGRKQKADVL